MRVLRYRIPHRTPETIQYFWNDFESAFTLLYNYRGIPHANFTFVINPYTVCIDEHARIE